MKARAVWFLVALSLGVAFAGKAQTLTSSFQLRLSGLVGTAATSNTPFQGQTFSNAAITITAVANTSNRGLCCGSVYYSLRAKGLAVVVGCEASARDGETLGVRLASWAFDLNGLPNVLPPWWTIVEIAPYSEVYESAPDALFLKALVQTANRAIRTGDPSRPWACCPSCGSKRLSWDDFSNDHLADDIYYFVKCLDCGWCEEFK